MKDDYIRELDDEDAERQEYIKELERLVACYQIASRDDKNVVWAALNKYIPSLTL